MNWNIQKKKKANFFRKFYLIAELMEEGNKYTLKCSWEQCIYILTISKNTDDEWIFYVSIFADDNVEKITETILSVTDSDVESNCKKLLDLELDSKAEYMNIDKIESITCK